MAAIGKLVVLIPAFNEEATMGRVIKAVPKKIPNIRKIETLVLDDGSSDRTVEEARKAGATKIVSHDTNKGLGVAIRNGIWEALKMGADLVVNIDADGQFNPQDIPKIIEPIARGEAEVVSCSRFLKKEFRPKMPWVKRFGNSVFTKLISLLTKKKFTDTQCGFRAYSKEACLRMNLFGKFTYTQEALLDLANKGFRIKEVACRVRGEREHGKSKVVGSWYGYGVKALIIIIRSIRDYKPLKFFGGIGLAMILVGGITALALFIRLLVENKIDPFMWVIYVDVILIVIGFLLIILALIADMSDRQRKIQEEILYRLKRQEIEGKK